MGKFNELNNNINKVLMKLISSENLCKLLYYDVSNPLSQADISDKTVLLYTKIYPYPFTPDSQTAESSILSVIFNDFSLSPNPSFKNNSLELIIICHHNLWRIDEMLRPFAILNELDEIFNNERVIGIGKGEFRGCRLIWADKNWSGYKLMYENWEFN